MTDLVQRVAALSGRRIDPIDATFRRFPLDCVPKVMDELASMFAEEKVSHLVCSAACGADLLALRAAMNRSMGWHIVLPFDLEKFRRISVEDRPGNWGRVLDEVLAVTTPTQISVIPAARSDAEAYEVTVAEILKKTYSLNGASRPLAVCVWEGRRKERDDITGRFLDIARMHGMRERQILTLCDA